MRTQLRWRGSDILLQFLCTTNDSLSFPYIIQPTTLEPIRALLGTCTHPHINLSLHILYFPISRCLFFFLTHINIHTWTNRLALLRLWILMICRKSGDTTRSSLFISSSLLVSKIVSEFTLTFLSFEGACN